MIALINNNMTSKFVLKKLIYMSSTALSHKLLSCFYSDDVTSLI